MRGGVVFVVVLLMALVADYAVLSHRPPRVEVSWPTSSATGQTWLVVGLDDRSQAADPDNGDFGTGPDKPTGARADVVVVIRPGVGAVSVSRDLVVKGPDDQPQRLGMFWLRSPQAFVDEMCRALQVPATHLVAIDMRGFQNLVNSLGGVEVTLPEPRRDRRSGLNVPAGRQTLDGRTALALVRSRQGEVQRAGRWIADPDGEAGREALAGQVMATVLARAKHQVTRNPVVAQTVAWRVLPDLTLDTDTSLLELAGLRSLPPIEKLPVHHIPQSNLAESTPETAAALARLGLAGDCHVTS